MHVGVRELKNQATEIVRKVREEQAEYVITYYGRPVAVLLPVNEAWLDTEAKHAIEAVAMGKRVGEMYQVRLDEAEGNLSKLVNAALEGEQILILQDNQQVVQLVPVAPPERHPHFGSAKGLVTMSDDFDAPLEDFAEYMP